VAAVCIEHLGAREWTGGFHPTPHKATGRFELGISFATTREIGAEFVKAISDGGAGPVAVYLANDKAWGPGTSSR
jgi:hypothetical protein